MANTMAYVSKQEAMGLSYRQHFETQSAQFFIYLISLITALSVNGMWQEFFCHKGRSPWWKLGVAGAMIAVCIGIVALISVWTDKSDDREDGIASKTLDGEAAEAAEAVEGDEED